MAAKLRYYLDPAVRARGIDFNAPRAGDAGFDLRAAEDTLIPSGAQDIVPTGLKIAVPDGYVGIVKDRSSMASKRIYTHAGVIDAGYRGEVRIVLSNHSERSFQIQAGDKIAQLVIVPCETAAEEAASEEDLGSTERGHGGFGSTGR